jgi:ketosteroid isomerase-like protein
MRAMKNLMAVAGAAAIALSASQALAQAPKGAQATADAVRAADAAFAARAQVVPVAQAFREYMDEKDGLQFNGGEPTRGSAAIYAAMGGDKPQKSRLEWTPVGAWGAASGDMGVTTGTWKASAVDGSRPPITGRYVTVWRKDAKGAWKGLIDIGNPDDPQPTPPSATPAKPAQ